MHAGSTHLLRHTPPQPPPGTNPFRILSRYFLTITNNPPNPNSVLTRSPSRDRALTHPPGPSLAALLVTQAPYHRRPTIPLIHSTKRARIFSHALLPLSTRTTEAHTVADATALLPLSRL